ncbi:MAG: TonB-dependent receptor, partial [Bacteroidia bacterium]|nr:TonB-dependent receptor [Bacteroidia bacterium]MDW8334102.1 TonB-dependent receptor [Bacteroidia bacterium]
QITTEQLGLVRGLGKTFGLNYLPGTWVESVQIIKGAGSVVNGYEALTGQINAELVKPFVGEFLRLNSYANTVGRGEANVCITHPVSAKWGSATLLHGSFLQADNDMNHDGFLDAPKYAQYNVAHRWRYEGGDGREAVLGMHAVWDDVEGGQIRAHHPGAVLYPYRTATRRLALWGKGGAVFSDDGCRSTGVQIHATLHDQRAVFGRREYSGLWRQFQFNWLWQSDLFSESHVYRTGASFLADDYRERFDAKDFGRTEWVPGAFFEYTFKAGGQLTSVAGLRADWHNRFGLMVVPRLHAKYSPNEKTAIRFGGGRAWRTPNVFADHYGAALSSRAFIFPQTLRPEIGWNVGTSVLRKFFVGKSSFYLSADYFYTVFENRLLADFDVSPQEIHFRYRREVGGRSFAHAAQIEFGYTYKELIEAKAAYKYYDVRETLAGTLRLRPLVAPHRALANVSFRPKSWAFDATMHVFGPQRLPITESNPERWRRPAYAPAYAVFMAQITKKFGRWEVYVGGENLGGFRQPDPIVALDDPFGPRFDATMVWGPLMGPLGYVGMRYTVKETPPKKQRLPQ